jgi:hypothetical protein
MKGLDYSFLTKMLKQKHLYILGLSIFYQTLIQVNIYTELVFIRGLALFPFLYRLSFKNTEMHAF